jgi:hypothetical protein
MPSKNQIEALGHVINELVYRATSYDASKQICEEFAAKLFAESRQKGEEIVVLTVRGTDGRP